MHLRPVTHADLPAFATAVAQAMRSDEVIAYTAPYRDTYPLSFERYVLYRASKRFYSGQFLFLVVSDSDDIDWTGCEVVMGYCCYSTTVESVEKPYPGGWLGNSFERWALDAWGRYSSFFKLDRSADPAAERHFRKVCSRDMFEQYFAHLPAAHKKAHGDAHWELELLGTLSQFRRRGVGKMALGWGFERARIDGVPVVVLSSIAGEKLYANAGFKVVEKINMLPSKGEEDQAGELGKITKQRLETTDFGLGVGKGLEWSAMVWEPEPLQQERTRQAVNQA